MGGGVFSQLQTTLYRSEEVLINSLAPRRRSFDPAFVIVGPKKRETAFCPVPSFCALLLISCRPAAVHYQVLPSARAGHRLPLLLTRNDHHKIAGDHRRTWSGWISIQACAINPPPPVSSLSSLMLSRLTNPEQSRSQFPSQPHQPRTLGWIIPLFRD